MNARTVNITDVTEMTVAEFDALIGFEDDRPRNRYAIVSVRGDDFIIVAKDDEIGSAYRFIANYRGPLRLFYTSEATPACYEPFHYSEKLEKLGEEVGVWF